MKRRRRSDWKGPRKQVGPRLPVQVYDRAAEDARAHDVSIHDWLAHVSALYYGLEELSPVYRNASDNSQEELPTAS